MSAPGEQTKKTRRDCTILGMQVFAAGMAGALLVVWTAPLAMLAVGKHHEGADTPVGIIRRLFAVSVIAVPPAVAFGALAGFETYRLAVGSVPWRRTGSLITWWLPLFWGLVLLLFAGVNTCVEPEFGLCFGPILALLLSNSILVNVIVRWRDRGQLAAPVSHKFQYSLGTLLIFVLGLGAWLTALVKIFGR